MKFYKIKIFNGDNIEKENVPKSFNGIIHTVNNDKKVLDNIK
jgi:hypothetical protein